MSANQSTCLLEESFESDCESDYSIFSDEPEYYEGSNILKSKPKPYDTQDEYLVFSLSCRIDSRRRPKRDRVDGNLHCEVPFPEYTSCKLVGYAGGNRNIIEIFGKCRLAFVRAGLHIDVYPLSMEKMFHFETVFAFGHVDLTLGELRQLVISLKALKKACTSTLITMPAPEVLTCLTEDSLTFPTWPVVRQLDGTRQVIAQHCLLRVPVDHKRDYCRVPLVRVHLQGHEEEHRTIFLLEDLPKLIKMVKAFTHLYAPPPRPQRRITQPLLRQRVQQVAGILKRDLGFSPELLPETHLNM